MRLGEKWKVTVIDGGNGGTYQAEFTVTGGQKLFEELGRTADSLAPNCIHELKLEYVGEIES